MALTGPSLFTPRYSPLPLSVGFPSYAFSGGKAPALPSAAVNLPVSGGFGNALADIVQDPIKFKRVFGETGDGSDAGENSNAGAQGGGKASASKSSSIGNAPGTSSSLGGWASKGSQLGGAIGAVTGLGAIGGLAGNIAGNIAEQSIANEQLEALGFDTIGTKGLARAVANKAVPFGLGDFLGVGQAMEQQYAAMFGFGLGPAADPPMGSFDAWGIDDPYGPSPSWDTDIANRADNFGGWGGDPDTGPSDNYGTTDDGNYGGDFGSSGSDDDSSGGGAAGGGSGGSGGSGNDTDDW